MGQGNGYSVGGGQGGKNDMSNVRKSAQAVTMSSLLDNNDLK